MTDAWKSRLLLPSPEDEAQINDQVELIKKYMLYLSYREREVLKCIFGLGKNGQEYNLEETARIFRVTRERVRLIKAKAIRKIQNWADLRGK